MALDLLGFDASLTHRPHVLGATNPSLETIYAAQHGRCIDCGAPMERHPSMGVEHPGYTVDHLFPRSCGFGLYANKVLACRACNERKADHPPSRRVVHRTRALYERLFPRRTLRVLRSTHPLWVAYAGSTTKRSRHCADLQPQSMCA